MSQKLILGVGDYGVVSEPGGVVKTLALGSCIAICMLDRKTRCIGMAHVALPDSKISPERAKDNPGHFADTAVPALLAEMKKKAGSVSKGAGLIVKLAGGANVADTNNTFNIGKRNALAIRKVLWQYGLGAVAEDVGGNFSRSVAIHKDTGKVILSSPGRVDWEI